MTMAELEMYLTTIDQMEERIRDDDEYPVVRDNKIKICCKYRLEITKYKKKIKINKKNEKKNKGAIKNIHQ